MKRTLKKIICSVFILFSIISIIALIYDYYIIKEAMSQQNLSSQTESMHQEIINLQDGMSINTFSKIIYYNGMSTVLYQMLSILVVSILAGIILGLILSIKESSITKYILFFILGNSLYNIFMGVLIQGIYLKAGINISFFEAFFMSFTSTIFIYSILFFFVVIINLISNKVKINTLNKLCNKNKSN